MAETQSHQRRSFFHRWAVVVLRYRWLLLVLSVVGTIGAAGAAGQQLRVDPSVEAFASSEDESTEVLEVFRDEFGRDDLFLVVVEGDVFTPEYLKRLEKLHNALKELDVDVPTLGQRRNRRSAPSEPQPDPQDELLGDFMEDEGWGDEAGGALVDEITSLINVRRTRATPEGIEVGELMNPLPSPEALPDLKKEVLSDPTLVGQVVDAKGRFSVISLRTQFMSDEDSARVNGVIGELCQRHQAPGFRIFQSGLPQLNAGMTALMDQDLKRLSLVSFVIMIVVLAFLFRHPLGVFGPLAVVFLAILNMVAFMALADLPMTLLTNVLPSFLICVAIGDSVHLVSVYRELRREGTESRDAVIEAVGTTGVPILFTTLTTAVGLMSFQLASIEAIKEMGLAGAFGVMMAMLHSLVLMPILLSFNRKGMRAKARVEKRDLIHRFLDGCLWLSGDLADSGVGPEPAAGRRRRRTTLVVGAMIAVCAGLGISILRVSHNPLQWLPEGDPTRVSFETMDRHLGGTVSLQFLIESEKGIRDLELMDGLAKLQEHIKAYEDPEVGPIVGNAVSILDPVRETHQALNGGDRSQYRVPDTERGVSDMLFVFENAGPEELRRLATTDMRRAQMTLRIKWLDAISYAGLAEHIDRGIEKYMPSYVKVSPTGSVYTLVSTIGALIRDLLRSFGAAFVAIALFMVVLFRSLRLGLLAMVPNLLPIAVVLGVMGFGDIPIDLNNVLVASISLGIAVDDTVHFLHHFQTNHQATGNVEQAIARAMRHSGRAMVSTSLILMLGFFAYLGGVMENLQRFGLLVGLTAGIALLVDLTLTPALLRAVYSRRATAEEENKGDVFEARNA